MHNVYKEIFYLVKDVGFDANYVERLTPAERKIFWIYHKEDEKEKAKAGKGEQYFDALSDNLPPDMVK